MKTKYLMAEKISNVLIHRDEYVEWLESLLSDGRLAAYCSFMSAKERAIFASLVQTISLNNGRDKNVIDKVCKCIKYSFGEDIAISKSELDEIEKLKEKFASYEELVKAIVIGKSPKIDKFNEIVNLARENFFTEDGAKLISNIARSFVEVILILQSSGELRWGNTTIRALEELSEAVA